MRDRSVFFKLLICIFLLSSANCTVYKSEGKKNFESASNDYGSRGSSSSFEDCQVVTPEMAHQLLEQHLTTASTADEVVYSEEDENYYQCTSQSE